MNTISQASSWPTDELGHHPSSFTGSQGLRYIRTIYAATALFALSYCCTTALGSSALSAYQIKAAAEGQAQEPPAFLKEALAKKADDKQADSQLRGAAVGGSASSKDGDLKLLYIVTAQDRVPNGISAVEGYFYADGRDAVYQFALNPRTQKLEDRFVCVYDVEVDASQTFASEQLTLKALDEGSRSGSLRSIAFSPADVGILKQFESTLPKFLDWKKKAEEIKPEPFEKLIPGSEVTGGAIKRGVSFVWGPKIGTGDGPPEPHLRFFSESGGRVRTDRIFNKLEVAALYGALSSRSEAEAQLAKLLRLAKEQAGQQQQTIQRNFN